MSDNNFEAIGTQLTKLKDALFELREKGEIKRTIIKEDIKRVKHSKFLSAQEKEAELADLHQAFDAAVAETEKNKAEVARLQKDALALSKQFYAQKIAEVKKRENEKIAQFKQEHAEAKKVIIEAYTKDIASGVSSQQAKAEKKSKLFELDTKCRSNIERSNEEKNKAYLEEVQTNIQLRNGKTNILEDWNLAVHEYIYKFKLSSFLLENGLYLAILIFFIFCIVVAPLKGSGQLLTIPNIFTILEQSSTRMFYALGVAGLILLAGTDLSVGRMVALGSVITGLILHPGENIVTFFGMGPWNFVGMPMFLRLSMALIISIVLCVLFSTFAGMFTAKLKIHPFISTLSTQLIIYGLLFFGTSGTPVGSIDSNIKDLLGGRWILGVLNGELVTFPKLIIPAVIAIIVAYFIWNKTTFGKNMYAVGGNQEAAAVSGISVFKVTMGVFIMAGIFYGIGAFLEAFRANASAGTGQGYELDAIAACVVGGISFNGGIGKIGGAVIGVIIFTSLTYCLTFLGIDTNLQFVFKGLIIITAVALDSVKYLKKK